MREKLEKLCENLNCISERDAPVFDYHHKSGILVFENPAKEFDFADWINNQVRMSEDVEDVKSWRPLRDFMLDNLSDLTLIKVRLGKTDFDIYGVGIHCNQVFGFTTKVAET